MRQAKSRKLTDYPRPSVAVDIVALTVENGQLHVALYKRAEPPQPGSYALPGGFMHIDESPEEAANRVMAQKVGLGGIFLEQLYTFGDIGRDPRGRVVTIAYYALVDARRFAVKRAPQAVSARIE